MSTETEETKRHKRFLRLAVEQALQGARGGHGGPFGAVVVRKGRLLATGYNEVTSRNDPTAHAEIQALRAACAALKTFQLDGCDVYASCEPCPMCLGALYWARPRAVYYAATRADAAAAGFDDAFLYDELARTPGERRLAMARVDLEEAGHPFELWRTLPFRTPY
jgi:guanine deaminase